MSILNLLKKDSTNPAPLLALAPMAGVSDLIFRTICENLGADYSVTEMLASAPQLIRSKKNSLRINFVKNTNAKIIQIIGNSPRDMANAAAIYTDYGVDVIDLNFGCPARKVSKKGAGSALLKDLALSKQIIQAVSQASSKPITVKTRLGWYTDQPTLLEFHKIVEDLGIKMLTIHGRSGEEKFNHTARYDLIAELKQISHIPIIVNGDIDSVEKAQKVIAHTKCDGIMIGRSAIGRPWLFKDIHNHFNQIIPICFGQEKSRSALILSHIQKIHANYGDKGVILARKHIKNYLFEIFHSDVYFKNIARVQTPKEQIVELEKLLNQANYF